MPNWKSGTSKIFLRNLLWSVAIWLVNVRFVVPNLPEGRDVFLNHFAEMPLGDAQKDSRHIKKDDSKLRASWETVTVPKDPMIR